MAADHHHRLPLVPEGWVLVDERRFGPFVTGATWERPDGTLFSLSTREHRKAGTELEPHHDESTPPRASRVSRWLAVLFCIGSACFVIGPIPAYVQAVGPTIDAITYFVGSIFFTSAGYLQYLEASNVRRTAGTDLWEPGPRRAIALEPRRMDWWAAAIQFAGTLFFNVTTFAAVRAVPGLRAEELRVWAPDAFGSICFLVSSLLAYVEATSGAPRADRDPAQRLGWRIAMLNLVGSVLFGVSAIGAFIVPDTGSMANAVAANAGTFGGGVCFFVAAALLPAESRAAARSTGA